MAGTLLEKIWDAHLVREQSDTAPAVLYIDFHLLNEVTSPQAFSELRRRGVAPHRAAGSLAVIDHSTPTLPQSADGTRPYVSRDAENQVQQMQSNSVRQGIRFLGWDHPSRGIVHVVGPELGLTLPGMTIVCGDSHTSTHGAFGALAFGIGTSEVAQVLATQCLLQRRPRTMRITISGELGFGVSAKDLALYVVTVLGASGATGYVIEYAGEVVERLSMEARMTLCNMSIECGARAGLIAPDQTTFDWLRNCPEAPADLECRVLQWAELKSDAEALFDKEVQIDAGEIEPMVTWGISPDTAVGISQTIPDQADHPLRRGEVEYMGLTEGEPMTGTSIDYVFIGSCTNARISDLQIAASILKDRRVGAGITVLIVPGSESVRRAAEAQGLAQIFLEAGADWRLAGCSMCLGMNGDLVPSGKTVVSTTNRNFKGRQGPGSRTILASPATAAASAVAGCLVDPRGYMA